MNKLAVITMAGIVAVVLCLIMIGLEVNGQDNADAISSESPDPNLEDQSKFVGNAIVDGMSYKSFEEAVKAAKLSTSKTVEISSGSIFKAKSQSPSYDCWYYNVEGLTIDLGGSEVFTQYMGLVLEGTGFTIQNGTLTTQSSYALFIGNGDDETSDVTITNMKMNGGVNVFVAQEVKLEGLEFTGRNYYAAWSDECGNIVIKAGKYKSAGNAVFGLATKGEEVSEKNTSLRIEGGMIEIGQDQPLVFKDDNDRVAPEIIGGFFYGSGAKIEEISGYVPSGYCVIATDYNGIQGFEVVPIISIAMNAEGDGSVDHTELKVYKGAQTSIADNELKIADNVITAIANDGYIFTSWLGVPSTIVSDITITALFMKVSGDDQVEVDTDSARISIEKAEGTTTILSEIKTEGVDDIDAAITEALDDIVRVQEASGVSSENVAVQMVVPVSGEEGQLRLSNTTVTKLKESGAVLEVNNNGMTVSLETEVIEALAAESGKQSSEMLSIVVTPNTKELSDKQKTVVMENQAVDVSAYLGEKKISDLGGTARISVPYQTDNKVKVTYVKDDGTTEDVDCTYVDGIVSFTTTHFSVFMISEVKSPSFIIIPDTSDDFPVVIPTPSAEKTDSGSDDAVKVAVILGAIVVVLVALVALTHKTR